MQSDLKKILGGICLICGGLFIIIPLLVSISNIIVNPARPWADLIITFDLWVIFFCILIFVLPAIYLMYTSRLSSPIKYNGPALAWYIGITILTLICIIIVTLAGGVIAESSHGTDFRTYFYHNFGYCLGIGFLFSLLVICFSLITAKLNH